MIAFIQGEIDELTPTYVVINTGGVGYHLSISLNTFSKLEGQKTAKVYSHLAVREDAHLLFGFFEKDERSLFRLLISVSGVGGNTALMMLSSMGPHEIQEAIASNNVPALKAIKGIGEKTAKRIILDLKDKISKNLLVENISSPLNNTIREEALSALVALGFAKNGTEKALDKILKNADTQYTVEKLIKVALKSI